MNKVGSPGWLTMLDFGSADNHGRMLTNKGRTTEIAW